MLYVIAALLLDKIVLVVFQTTYILLTPEAGFITQQENDNLPKLEIIRRLFFQNHFQVLFLSNSKSV